VAFRGTFEYTLDAKNRLTVPAKFRAALADGVVLAKGVDRCMAIWTPDAYEVEVARVLEGFRPGSAQGRELARFFAANAIDTELDSAGRVMVPAFLLEHAGLGKEVVVTGAGECLEVWDRAAWRDYNASLSQRISDITASLDTSP
jgi:MraZ protein